MTGPMVTIPLDQFLALIDAQSPERRAALQISVSTNIDPVKLGGLAQYEGAEFLNAYGRSLVVAAKGEAAAREWDELPPARLSREVMGPALPRPRWEYRGSSADKSGGAS